MGLLDVTVVVPARNEAAAIRTFLLELTAFPNRPSEVIVVNDYSTDETEAVVASMGVRCLKLLHPPGYGGAIRAGLSAATQPYVTIMTADGSDSVEDLLQMYLARRRAAMIFGDRWGRRGQADGYPTGKRWINRLGNRYIGYLTHTRYRDWTNPFKLYQTRHVQPLLHDCVERGHAAGLELALQTWSTHPDFFVVPHHWRERRVGRSSFSLLRSTFPYLQTIQRVLA